MDLLWLWLLLWLPSAFTQLPHYHCFVPHELYNERGAWSGELFVKFSGVEAGLRTAKVPSFEPCAVLRASNPNASPVAREWCVPTTQSANRLPAQPDETGVNTMGGGSLLEPRVPGERTGELARDLRQKLSGTKSCVSCG